jgi:hypothetical protein
MTKRLKVIQASRNFILNMLRGGQTFTTNIPQTARCTGVYYDAWTQNLLIEIEDESFESVPEGMTIPRFELEGYYV